MCSAQPGDPSPGRKDKQSSQEDPFCPFLPWGTPGLGGPRPHLIGGPRLSPRSTRRPVRGDHYFKASSKTVLGQPKAGFYAWGRAPGTDGLKDQSGWGGAPSRRQATPLARLRTLEQQVKSGKGWNFAGARPANCASRGRPLYDAGSSQGTPLPARDPRNSALGGECDPEVPRPSFSSGQIEAVGTQRALRDASRVSGATPTPSCPSAPPHPLPTPREGDGANLDPAL